MFLAPVLRSLNVMFRFTSPESIIVVLLLTCSVFMHATGMVATSYLSLAAAYGASALFYVLNSEQYSKDDDKKMAPDRLDAPESVTRDELDIANHASFFDGENRRVLFRGINLGGESKTPFLTNESIKGDENVSFVGRPFDLSEADEHFSRLRSWGLTLVRLLVTWEAVEHAGPGIYDNEYLEYLRNLVRKGAEHGLAFVIDPHQDVWSRWTGGCGAPRWTLEIVGFDPDLLHRSGAAFTEEGFYKYDLSLKDTQKFPQMTWPSNHHRLGCATMFTLFFGGSDFAPTFTVNGFNIQEYLQSHFVAAMVQVAKTLKQEPNVLGFETMNEPNLGYIGYQDLAKPSKFLLQGPAPTFFESFLLGEGIPTTVKYYDPSLFLAGSRALNTEGLRAWKLGLSCIWRQNGVWDFDGDAKLLRPDYFYRRPKDYRLVNPIADYFVPFVRRFTEAIQNVHGSYKVFVVKPSDFEISSIATLPRDCDFGAVALASHWYDIVTVVCKSFRSWIGVKRSGRGRFPLVLGNQSLVMEYKRQLQQLQEEATTTGAGMPLIIGEIGCPMDLGTRGRHGWDKHMQVSAWDTILSAAEQCCLSFCIWNYTGAFC